MAYRSRFYQLYDLFRRGEYDQALNEVMRYRVPQKPTAFRRIYNYLARVLENVEQLEGEQEKQKEERRATTSGQERQKIDMLARAVARINIQVEYQKNRGLLAPDLADGIKAGLLEIIQSLRGGNTKEAGQRARALRDALDAVLAYVIIATRGREEEEWL